MPVAEWPADASPTAANLASLELIAATVPHMTSREIIDAASTLLPHGTCVIMWGVTAELNTGRDEKDICILPHEGATDMATQVALATEHASLRQYLAILYRLLPYSTQCNTHLPLQHPLAVTAPRTCN